MKATIKLLFWICALFFGAKLVFSAEIEDVFTEMTLDADFFESNSNESESSEYSSTEVFNQTAFMSEIYDLNSTVQNDSEVNNGTESKSPETTELTFDFKTRPEVEPGIGESCG